MNTIIFLIFVFAVFKLFQYLLKKSQEQTHNQPYNTKSIFSSYGSFTESETIESSLGFYSFSIDRDGKEFIFLTEDKAAYRLPYNKLRNYSVKTKNDSGILIELKTYITSKPVIEIECFNKLKALHRLPETKRSVTDLNILYKKEKDKILRIGDILDEILKHNQSLISTPPPYIPKEEKKEEKKEEIPPLPVITEVPDIKEPVEEYKEKEAEGISEEITDIIEVEEVPIDETEKPIEIVEIVETPQEETEIAEEKPEENKPVSDETKTPDLVRVSLSDVEYYSHGKFLEPEVQYEVGEAKMRGKKEITITKEQLERLKQ